MYRGFNDDAYFGLIDELYFGFLQELRTKRILDKYTPKNAERILDVGGATGVYSFYLAEKGYTVDLFDIVPKHIDLVNEKNRSVQFKLNKAILGDIRYAEIKQEYDMIILHGPLYHLKNRADRVDVLKRLRRNLTKDGIMLGFAIHRYACLFYGLSSGNILDAKYRSIIFEALDSGNNLSDPGWFYHSAKTLENEFKEANYKITHMKSVTTQAWMIPDLDRIIEDIEFREKIINIAELLENEIDIGQDLVCMAKR